jgi:hypothetical protein
VQHGLQSLNRRDFISHCHPLQQVRVVGFLVKRECHLVTDRGTNDASLGNCQGAVSILDSHR